MDSVEAQLTEIFREIFDDDSLALRPHYTAKDIKGWDSMKQVEILIAVSERFGVHLSSKEVDGLQTVGDLSHLISQKSTQR